jgi:signal transduction histidine kinase/PAS domain-containing protein
MISCSDAMAKMYGFEHGGQLVGLPLGEVMPPTIEHNRAYVRDFLQAGGSLSEAESVEVGADGEARYFLNNLVGVLEDRLEEQDGQMVRRPYLRRVWGTQRDITAQRRAEARSREAQGHFELVAESLPQMVWVADPDGAVEYFSSRWYDYLGTDFSTAGFAWEKFLHPTTWSARASAGANPSRPGEPYEIQYRIRRGDGVYRWFLGLALPLRENDHHATASTSASTSGPSTTAGRVTKWFGTCTDIDDAKRAEESLRLLADVGQITVSSLEEAPALDRLARRLVPQLADWCLIERVSPEGRSGSRFELLALAHADPARESVLRAMRTHAVEENGYGLPPGVLSRGEPLFQPVISEEMLGHIAVDDKHREYLREVGMAGGMSVPLVAREQVLGVMSLGVGPGRALEEADFALALELSRRVAQSMDNAALYRQAQNALLAAEEAGRAKDSFLAIVSHELRTPLTSIMGWANLLRHGRVDAETTQRALETIERNVKVQAQLVEDLLDTSRIIAGKLSLKMDPVEIAPIVSAAVESVRPALNAKSITLHESVHGRPVAAGDPERLQQVVWNLLANAVKFTPENGRIELQVSAPDATSGGAAEGAGDPRAVRIRVRDSGPGVPPEFAPHIFERFRQADSSPTRRHGGLGLGLAIVRHLVEAHGGTVRLEPVEEPAAPPAATDSDGAMETTGATFTVELPALEPGAPHAEVAPALRFQALLEGKDVLVVEDEADARELLQVILSRFGARVRIAASAEAALEILKSMSFDVLVSDIGMPDQDGYALIRRVRRNWSTRDLPAVALTAFAGGDDRTAALSAGFNAHLPKPVSPEDLAAVLADLLQRPA